MTMDRNNGDNNSDATTTMAHHKRVLELEINDAHERQDKVWIRRLSSQTQNDDDGDGDEQDDHQYGIFARCDIPKGEVVMEGRRQRTVFTSNDESSDNNSNAILTSIRNEPGTHTIQIDWNKHVTLDLPSRFVNHVCGVANIGIQCPPPGEDDIDNDNGIDETVYYNFVALSNIRKGDEILWDYECSEYELLNDGFTCTCGVKSCRKQIRGYKYHGEQVLQTYGKEYIAPYLLRSKPES